MVVTLSAGVGLVILATGVSLIGLVTHRPNKTRQPVVQPSVTHCEHQLPVLSAVQLFEQTGTLGVLATIEAKLGFSREHFHRSVPPVVHAYAEFVQQLPLSESQHHAHPGGLLIHALEVVDFALTFRRGQILPSGGAPEDIMRLEHRWTYAVFVAALLHNIERLIADLRVTLYGPRLDVPKIWTPLSGPMGECGATYYSVEFPVKGERDESLHARLPVFLLERWVPQDILRWLSIDRELMFELMATLAGDQACGSGAIRQLVLRAEAEPLKRNLLLGSQTRSRRGSYPPDTKGTVVVIDNSAKETGTPAGGPHQVAMPNSTNDPVEGTTANPVEKNRASAHRVGNGAAACQEEYLDDVEELTDNAPSQSAVNHVESTAPKPQLLSPVSPACPVPPLSGGEEAKSPPEAALRFMSWLQAGIADGTLTFNLRGAMVHFVKEGMLLVSPRIFQHFASAFGEDGRGKGSSASRENKDLGFGIQKQLLKADWHIRREKGISILPYQVLRGGKSPAPISGVVIANPQRFVSPVPPANPHVVRLAKPVEGMREHGLSA